MVDGDVPTGTRDAHVKSTRQRPVGGVGEQGVSGGREGNRTRHRGHDEMASTGREWPPQRWRTGPGRVGNSGPGKKKRKKTNKWTPFVSV